MWQGGPTRVADVAGVSPCPFTQVYPTHAQIRSVRAKSQCERGSEHSAEAGSWCRIQRRRHRLRLSAVDVLCGDRCWRLQGLVGYDNRQLPPNASLSHYLNGSPSAGPGLPSTLLHFSCSHHALARVRRPSVHQWSYAALWRAHTDAPGLNLQCSGCKSIR
jgi:hypothetical protein